MGVVAVLVEAEPAVVETGAAATEAEARAAGRAEVAAVPAVLVLDEAATGMLTPVEPLTAAVATAAGRAEVVRVGVVRGATKTAEAAIAEVATQSRTCSVGYSRDLMKVATATSAREATLHGNPLTRGLSQGRAACAHAVAQAIPQSSSSNLRPSAIDFAVLTRGHTGRSPEPIPLTRSAMARRDARLGHDKSRKRLDGSTPDAQGQKANAIESTAVEMRRSSSDAHRPSDGAYRPHRLAPPAAKALNATTRHSLSRICATGHINNGGQACSGQVVASGRLTGEQSWPLARRSQSVQQP